MDGWATMVNGSLQCLPHQKTCNAVHFLRVPAVTRQTLPLAVVFPLFVSDHGRVSTTERGCLHLSTWKLEVSASSTQHCFIVLIVSAKWRFQFDQRVAFPLNLEQTNTR